MLPGGVEPFGQGEVQSLLDESLIKGADVNIGLIPWRGNMGLELCGQKGRMLSQSIDPNQVGFLASFANKSLAKTPLNTY